ncbi:MAG TPA: VOC family protein [Bacillota bacterium]
MITSIDKVTVFVRDEEEALKFYTEKLGFEKRMDMTFGPGARWLTVAPKGAATELILHNPRAWHGPEEAESMLAQVGKSPTMVMGTRDCRGTVEELKARGVTILAEPQERPYGVEAIFADLYGNGFVLVEPGNG